MKRIISIFIILSSLYFFDLKGVKLFFDWDVYTHDEEKIEECQEMISE